MINFRWLVTVTPGSMETMGMDMHSEPVLQVFMPRTEYREVEGRGVAFINETVGEWMTVPTVYFKKET